MLLKTLQMLGYRNRRFRPQSRPSFVPRLASLEDRIVPANHVWTGLGATDNWSEAANWFQNSVPTSNESGGTTVDITVNDAGIIQNIAALTIARLTFSNSGSSTLTLNQPLSFNGTLFTNDIINSGGTNIINGPSTLKMSSGNLEFANFGGSLALGAAISGSNSVIVNSTPGVGFIEFRGLSDYTGATFINKGVVKLAGVGGVSVPDTAVHIGNGINSAGAGSTDAILQLGSGNQLSPLNDLVISNDGFFAMLGTDEDIGNLTMSGGTVDTGGGTLICDDLDLNVTGGAAVIRGDSASDPGALQLTGITNINVATSASLDIAVQVSGDGSFTVNADAANTGTVTLSNPDSVDRNNHAGTLNVFHGTLLADAATDVWRGDGLTFEFITVGTNDGGSAVLRCLASNQFTSASGDRIVLVHKGGLFDLNGTNQYVSGLRYFDGGQTKTGAGTLTTDSQLQHHLTSNPPTTPVTASFNGNLTLVNNTQLVMIIDDGPATIDFQFTGTIAGPSGFNLRFSGDGTSEISGPSVIASGGMTSIDSGTLILNATTIDQAAGLTVTVGNGLDPSGDAVLRLNGPNQIPNLAAVTVRSDGILDLGANAETITSLTLGSTNGGGTVIGTGLLTINGDITSLAATAVAFESYVYGPIHIPAGFHTITVGDGLNAIDLAVFRLTGPGSIIKTGPGIIVLIDSSDFTGGTTHNQSDFVLNSDSLNSPVTVNSGALSYGGRGSNGTISMNGGTLSPQSTNGPTQLMTSKSIALTPTSTYRADLLGTIPGYAGDVVGGFDQHTVNGTVSLGGATLDVNLQYVPGQDYIPAFGLQFPIILNDGADAVVGTFNGLPEGKVFTADGRPFRISYVGGTGNDIVLTEATPHVVSITSASANGVYTTGQSIDFRLNFNTDVNLSGGNLMVTLDTGAVVSIAPFSGMVTNATYVIAAGQTSPDLNVTSMALTAGATLRDPFDLDASLALPASNLAVNANLIVNPLPPTTVTAVTINLGDLQRSRVTTITLDFAVPVSAAQLALPGVIALTRTSGGPATVVQTGATGPNGRINLSAVTGMVTSLTLTFSNADSSDISAGVEHGSLSDGRWQLSIPWLSYVSPQFHRLFGDIDGNATVDGPNDFAAFGNVFGATLPDNPFDFDANGTIDGPVDFAQFGARFGLTI